MNCRHCKKSRAYRPRRLCGRCFDRRDIRDLYPSASKYGQHGSGLNTFNAPLASFPTMAWPGTPEKIAVLQLRAAMGQQLFHPLDGRG